MMKFIHEWGAQDRFEADGRRYVVARRNEPRPKSPLALTLRERQVLGHMVQGDSVKVAAYALGRAPSTVLQTAPTAAELARLVSVGGP